MYIRRKKDGKLIKITTHAELEQNAMLEQQIQQAVIKASLTSGGVGGDTPSSSGSAA